MNFKKVKGTKIVVLFVVVFFIYIYIGNIGRVELESSQEQGTKTVGEILGGEEYGQEFIATENNISGFSFKLGTYRRVNDGDLEFGIKESGEEGSIFSTTIKAASIVDNDYFTFNFPPIKYSKHKKYYIYVRSLNGTPGNAVTLYMDDEPATSGFINNKIPSPGSTVHKVFYYQTALNVL